MQCWSCGKVKGKRPCPASHAALRLPEASTDGRDEKICSKCCGTKRRVEIACPSDCPYLHGEHDPKWESAEQQSEQTRFFSRFSGLEEAELPFLVFVHHLLFQSGPALEAVDDRALLHVVRTVSDTLDTRAKGIVYEHQSPRMDLQPAVQWLTSALTQRDQIPIAPKLTDKKAQAVLTRLADAVAAHLDAGEERPYLELARKVFAPLLAGAPELNLPEPPSSSGGLIVPP